MRLLHAFITFFLIHVRVGEEVKLENKSTSSHDASLSQISRQNVVAQHREDTERDNPDQVALESAPSQITAAKFSYNRPLHRDISLSLPSRIGPSGPQSSSHNFGKSSIAHHQSAIYNGISFPHALLSSTPPFQKNILEASDKFGDDLWPIPAVEVPKIINLDVKCEKNSMKVFIGFNKPFFGVVFSKGHYSNSHCVHIPAGLGRSSATFDINVRACGTTGNTENGFYGYGLDSGSGTYFENIIVIQYDPQVQEVWDQARKLRCTWHDQYEKSVTFRPFPVDMLDVVRADFAGDNVGCWMQIQVGKGPWASEVSGLVKIGQTMTMVLAIKDEDSKFDMLVRNCIAHDGKRAPVQLVDQRGCVTRSKLMSKFIKIKHFGASASVLSYAHFQAFKFPDSMEVHFQCTIQICRYQCPEQCSADTSAAPHSSHESIIATQRTVIRPDAIYGPPAPLHSLDLFPYANSRRDEKRVRKHKRDVQETKSMKEEIGVNRVIKVVSSDDLTFSIDDTKNNSMPTIEFPIVTFNENASVICMTTLNFSTTLVLILTILFLSCLISSVLCVRLKLNLQATRRTTASKKVHFLSVGTLTSKN